MKRVAGLATLLLLFAFPARFSAAPPAQTTLVEKVEVRRHAGEDRLRHLGPVGIAVHLAPGRFADAGLRLSGALDDRAEALLGKRARGGEGRHLERGLDPGELRLEAGQRLAEEAQLGEEARRVAARALRGMEVHDLDREAAADAVELAASIVAGGARERLFRRVLEASVPHACWGERPGKESIAAAHRTAWDSAGGESGAWLHSFLTEARLDRKLKLLLDHAPSPDAGSQAIAHGLLAMTKERAAAFAFAIYPAAALGHLPIGAEGVNDLAKVASPILSVDGEVSWQERLAEKHTSHPEISRAAKVLAPLDGARLERAKQFFSWCILQGFSPTRPDELEEQVQGCVELLKDLNNN